MNDAKEIPLAVLVVDDERHIRTTLLACIEREGHRVGLAATAQEALAAAGGDAFDVVFLDLRLGVDSGLDLIPALLEQSPWLKIIVITAHATIETAVEAMRRGATDYLPKPFEPAQVRIVLQKAAEVRALESRVETLRRRLDQAQPELHLESENADMVRLFTVARQVAGSDATVLIRGESGTGKGVLARALHAWSVRAPRPFVVVHAPSLSTELLESELFGHVKGAFTGAVRTNAGRVAQAEGGTLFLDEIGDLPLALQTKLLRFIQDHAYERVGDPAPRRADVRIVAATNQDLEARVRESRFREDLFYRLNVIELAVPPLRERTEDIVPLAKTFLSFFAHKYNRLHIALGSETETLLRRHAWPGNVRELQNAIERAVILNQGGVITPEQLPFPVPHTRLPAPQVGGMISLMELEEAHIRRVIDATATLDKAAEVLGIDPATLWRRRKQYGI